MSVMLVGLLGVECVVPSGMFSVHVGCSRVCPIPCKFNVMSRNALLNGDLKHFAYMDVGEGTE